MKKRIIIISIIVALIIALITGVILIILNCGDVPLRDKNIISKYEKYVRKGDTKNLAKMTDAKSVTKVLKSIKDFNFDDKVTSSDIKEMYEEIFEDEDIDEKVETYKIKKIYRIKDENDFEDIDDDDFVKDMEEIVDEKLSKKYRVYLLETEIDDEDNYDILFLDDNNKIALNTFCTYMLMSGAVVKNDSLDELEVQTFNSQFTIYDGKSLGITVKMLLEKIIVNYNQNKDDYDRIPDIYYNDYTNSEKSTYSSSTVTVYDFSTDYVKSIQNIRDKIAEKHYYTIETSIDSITGLIDEITINY